MARSAVALLLVALVAGLSVTNVHGGGGHQGGGGGGHQGGGGGGHQGAGWEGGGGWGSVHTDPHFVGFDGSKYDFHGYPHTAFAILSDKGHQLNAQFEPIAVIGGTWMHSIGLKHGRDEVEVRIVLDAEKRYATDMQAFANGRQLEKGETVSLPDGTVITLETDKPRSGHWALIETETYSFKIQNGLDVDIATDEKPVWIACLNLEEVRILGNIDGELHGVLGQTYSAMLGQDLQDASAQEATGENPYIGKDADYAVSSLFSHNFTFTKYIGKVGARLERARRLLMGPAKVVAASVTSA